MPIQPRIRHLTILSFSVPRRYQLRGTTQLVQTLLEPTAPTTAAVATTAAASTTTPAAIST